MDVEKIMDVLTVKLSHTSDWVIYGDLCCHLKSVTRIQLNDYGHGHPLNCFELKAPICFEFNVDQQNRLSESIKKIKLN